MESQFTMSLGIDNIESKTRSFSRPELIGVDQAFSSYICQKDTFTGSLVLFRVEYFNIILEK